MSNFSVRTVAVDAALALVAAAKAAADGLTHSQMRLQLKEGRLEVKTELAEAGQEGQVQTPSAEDSASFHFRATSRSSPQRSLASR